MSVSGRVIFCDDIRQEVNGKFILLGVFSGNMVVSGFPTSQKLCAFVTLDAVPTGTQLFDFSTSEGAHFGTLEVELEAAADAAPPFMLPIPPLMINLSQAATVRLRTRLAGEEDWQVLGEIKVESSSEPILTAYS